MTISESQAPSGRWAMTGSAGAIGQHLRSTLGHQFEELLLLDITEQEPRAGNERVAQIDLRDADALRLSLVDVDGIIHLGGIADEADFHDLAEVNIVGTYHLLEAARINAIPRVVYASSNRATGFYGTDEVVSPDDPFRPDGFYGVSKAAVEALCRLYSDKFGLEISCLRIGSYEAAPTTPRELRTWLSPDDCTRAFEAAIHGDYTFSTFYAASNNTQGWWDLSPGSAIGFSPRDDAEDFAAGILGDLVEPQGGVFATPEFTLSRQRRS